MVVFIVCELCLSFIGEKKYFNKMKRKDFMRFGMVLFFYSRVFGFCRRW